MDLSWNTLRWNDWEDKGYGRTKQACSANAMFEELLHLGLLTLKLVINCQPKEFFFIFANG